jgi:hypothetical protein
MIDPHLGGRRDAHDEVVERRRLAPCGERLGRARPRRGVRRRAVGSEVEHCVVLQYLQPLQ